jgi:hypothetical protein
MPNRFFALATRETLSSFLDAFRLTIESLDIGVGKCMLLLVKQSSFRRPPDYRTRDSVDLGFPTAVAPPSKRHEVRDASALETLRIRWYFQMK